MLPQALGAPARSHDAVGTLLIGGTLLLFSVLFPLIWIFALVVSPIWIILAPLAVFPPLLMLGYDLRVLEAGLREEAATPPFLDWSKLVRDGIRSILLGVVYLLPALVVLGTTSGIVAVLQTGQLPVSELVTNVATGISTAGAGTFLVLYVGVFLYIRPATLVVFAATGRMRAALSPRRVSRVALSTDYAIGWTMATIVLLIGGLIAAPLGLLLVGFLVAFYVRAVAYYSYGAGARTRVTVLSESSQDADTVQRDSTETVAGEASSTVVASTPAEDASAVAVRAEPSRTVRNQSATAGAEATTPTGPRTDGSTARSRQSLRVVWSPRASAEAPADVQVGRTVRPSAVSREPDPPNAAESLDDDGRDDANDGWDETGDGAGSRDVAGPSTDDSEG
jgi:hypothetical protein